LVNRKKSATIGVLSATVENVFFKEVYRGIRQAASELAELGVSLNYKEVAKFSVREQLRCIDDMLAEGIDALAINPINDDRIRKRLLETAEFELPIITFNSDIKGIRRLAYIGCDYQRTGRIAAALLAFVTRNKAEIAVVTGSFSSLGHSMRVDGFRKELGAHGKMRVAEVVECFDDDITAYAKVREIFERNGAINAFFFSAAGKEGGIRAIQECAPKRRPNIVTVDIEAFTRDCLLDGTVTATVCQQPYIQGYEPIRQLADYLLLGDEPAQEMQYTQAEIIIRQSLEA
jgi:LacI family transcriptional regulator